MFGLFDRIGETNQFGLFFSKQLWPQVSEFETIRFIIMWALALNPYILSKIEQRLNKA